MRFTDFLNLTINQRVNRGYLGAIMHELGVRTIFVTYLFRKRPTFLT